MNLHDLLLLNIPIGTSGHDMTDYITDTSWNKHRGTIHQHSLMGVFGLSNHPPTSQNSSINMIYNTIIYKGNSIVDESVSLTPFE